MPKALPKSGPFRRRTPASQPIRQVLNTCLLALAIATTFAAVQTQPAYARVDSKIYSTPKPLSEFKLQQASGAAFGREQLKGKWSLIVLGYTHCPDVCPFTLQNLAAVEEELSLRVSPARKPQVVFIGVDPDRDHKIIGEYVKYFSDDFVGATGDWSEVSKAVETLGGFVRYEGKDKDPEGYKVFHSANVIIVDPQGQLVGSVNPPLQPAEAADFIAALIAKRAREAAAKN